MIKNIIFDFGQVLVEFIPENMTRAYVDDEADIKIIAGVLFDRLYWDKLDAGTITDAEVISSVKKRLPERLWQQTEKVYINWYYNIPEIKGMVKVVEKLKKQGYNLCILSNISKGFVEHYKEIPALSLFENFVFSSACGMTKPNKDIYEYALKKYNFKAEETLFVDDRPENIKGAESVGIIGYVFDGDAEKFNKYIDQLKR